MTGGISVVIPAWNAARTLAETLRSVAAQDLLPRDVTVVDDGSDDGTAEVAAVAGEGLPVFRIVRQARQGKSAAVNAGAAIGSGEFLALLDADDVWPSGSLASRRAALSAGGLAGGAVGWVAEFVCPSLPGESAARFRPRPPQLGWLDGATLLRRETFHRFGGFAPEAGAVGWIDWVDRARRAGVGFVLIDDIVLRRRLHPGSCSTSAGTGGGRVLLQAARLAIARRRESPG